MIGAAGELYVYELLSNRNTELPDFSQEDWRSNIKKYVTALPEYADAPSWTGDETADFVYDDVKSVLTTLLIKKGYLDKDRWSGRTPTYYIEVKTTAGGCRNPFFMSNSQYQRMKDITNNFKKVYVICRVYNLGKQSMSCAIYVDPESLRTKGALKFATEKWVVVPGVPA
ncbi:hypothetical protein F4860DRAFT_457982 [Xylaria cubensis]|nr:hypothetical protein F4860DRAFT_457982 [Xylaria cubensis]